MRARFALALCLAAAASPALAQKEVPTAEKIDFAAREHDLGYRAYVAKDFETAAVHFENAFFNAPNPAELRSAIRARKDAKQYARAATLAALGLRKYPGDEPTIKVAEQAIAEAKPKVHEVKLECAEPCGVVADGKIVTIERAKEVRFFVDPGKHDLAVSFEEQRSKSLVIDAKPGGSETLKVEPPPAPPPPPSPPPPTAQPTSTVIVVPPTPREGPPKTEPLGPAVFFVGLGLTAVAGGFTIASGLDAQSNPGPDVVREKCVGLGETCPEYQQGRDAQMRTNVLLGVTGGLGLVTGIVGLFFTQWTAGSPRSGVKPEAKPVVGLNYVGLQGHF